MRTRPFSSSGVVKGEDTHLLLNTGKRVRLRPRNLFLRDDSLYMRMGEECVKFTDHGLVGLSSLLEDEEGELFVRVRNRRYRIGNAGILSGKESPGWPRALRRRSSILKSSACPRDDQRGGKGSTGPIMNAVFLAIVLVSFLTAAWQQVRWIPREGHAGPMEAVSRAMVDSAAGSVELALGLVGVMTLFLGLMKVAEAGGLLKILARLIRPLMVRLFPEVPAEHPAMGAMILNLSANVMGLGNAATPFGIRAMQELNRLNPHPGIATDAMALFLAINTSSVTLLPTGVIALRAAAGSSDPAGILPTTLFATACSTLIAVLAAKAFRRFYAGRPVRRVEADEPAEEPAPAGEPLSDTSEDPYPLWVSLAALVVVLAMIPVTVVYGKAISPWIIPGPHGGLSALWVASQGAGLRGLCGGGQGGVSGGGQDHPLPGGHPGGRGHAPGQWRHGHHGLLAGALDRAGGPAA